VTDTAKEYHPEILSRFGATCPPSEAQPVDQLIYRGILKPPISAHDFLSHVEAKLKGNNPEICEHWGLSVWASQADAEHARKAYRWVKFWHIAEGHVGPEDGVLLATPNDNHPEHHTFWKCFSKSLEAKFTIIFPPANQR
jgi:hypothetical protein